MKRVQKCEQRSTAGPPGATTMAVKGGKDIPSAPSGTVKELVTSSEVWKACAVVVVQLMALRKVADGIGLWNTPSSSATARLGEGGKNEDDPFAECSFYLPLIATTAYVFCVLAGKRAMRNREAWDVKQYMIVYNLYQTALNAYAVYTFIAEIIRRRMNIIGNPYAAGPHEFKLGFLLYVHYNNKYIELLDTFFMVVRKKNKQISFLHVYHHTLLIWSWFLVMKYNCGGDAYFGALANSFVHVIMYSYYLMALLKLRCPWKKYVTQVQLAQFVICFAQALTVLYIGTVPAWLTCVQIFVMINMLVLFGNFYTKNYRARSAATLATKKHL